MKQGSSLRAGQLSMILTGTLIAMLAILIGGSVFAASRLLDEATVANHAQIDADVSESDPERLEGLKQYLAKNADGVAQTAALTAGLGQYNQSSIVAAINGYASKAGVSISSFDFGTGATSNGATATVATGNTVSVTLASPMRYQNFIIFLRLLEQGLMPAQVTSGQVGVSDTPGFVNVSALGIQVAQ